MRRTRTGSLLAGKVNGLGRLGIVHQVKFREELGGPRMLHILQYNCIVHLRLTFSYVFLDFSHEGIVSRV